MPASTARCRGIPHAPSGTLGGEPSVGSYRQAGKRLSNSGLHREAVAQAADAIRSVSGGRVDAAVPWWQILGANLLYGRPFTRLIVQGTEGSSPN